MINEDYVSFETAKLLKEKGFNWNTDKQFNSDKIVGDYDITDRARNPERYLDAPTLQMVMKWLREKNIIINVWYNGIDWDAEYYNDEDENFYLITDPSCNSYEEACEAAIKYCLENLI